VDLIIAQDSAYGRSALARRISIDIAGTVVHVDPPEDALLAKLQWAKLRESDRQLGDAGGIIRTQGEGSISAASSAGYTILPWNRNGMR
jgi:hypothetical protein